MTRRILILVVVVIAGLAVAAVNGGWFRKDSGLQGSGTVEARNIRVGSKVGGRILEVRVREGDRVQPGQTLITFDDKELEASLAQARANAQKSARGFRPEEIQEAAAAALKTFEEVKKPDNVTDDAWAKQKTVSQLTLNGIAAQAAMNAKDCSGAVTYYKAALALNPDDLTFNYRLGQAYLCMNPPQQMDAFWSIARAVTAKGATQAQSAKVKDYLRKLIVNYQGGTVCDSLTDAELNELLQLAGSSAERPSSYSLPAAADLAAAQKDMTIASVVADLKAGGDKGKLTWLAACGLEFPEVPGKVIEVVKGSDSIVLKIAFVTSDAEFEAATTPNMDVKVAGQPEAARVEKDSAVHFTGTLTSYDPDPAFFLHWDKAKVKEEDIPKEKGAPKRPVRKPAARKPAAKPS